jgi:hypothetical protein
MGRMCFLVGCFAFAALGFVLDASRVFIGSNINVAAARGGDAYCWVATQVTCPAPLSTQPTCGGKFCTKKIRIKKGNGFVSVFGCPIFNYVEKLAETYTDYKPGQGSGWSTVDKQLVNYSPPAEYDRICSYLVTCDAECTVFRRGTPRCAMDTYVEHDTVKVRGVTGPPDCGVGPLNGTTNTGTP